MIKKYISNILNISSKNNKFFLILWILIVSYFLRYVIYLIIFLNFAAVLKGLFVFYNKKTINIYPNKNLFDFYILRFIVITSTNHNKLDLLAFLFFAYLIVFLFSRSLRSIHLSIELYNLIKLAYYTKFSIRDIYHSIKNLEKPFLNQTNIEIFYMGRTANVIFSN